VQSNKLYEFQSLKKISTNLTAWMHDATRRECVTLPTYLPTYLPTFVCVCACVCVTHEMHGDDADEVGARRVSIGGTGGGGRVSFASHQQDDDDSNDSVNATRRKRIKEAYETMLEIYDARIHEEHVDPLNAELNAFWRRFKRRENAPLALFLDALREGRRRERGASRNEEDTYVDKALGRAAKSVREATVVVVDGQSALSVKGIGVTLLETIREFWATSREPTFSRYGERIPARNFGSFTESLKRKPPLVTRDQGEMDDDVLRGILPTHHGDDMCADAPPAAASSQRAPKRSKTTTTTSGKQPVASTSGRATKVWVPGYRTAGFALLVTLHRLALEGKDVVTKAELEDETERSGLSTGGIKPKPQSFIGGRPAGPNFQYCGWNSFSHLKTEKPGYPEAMVFTWKKGYVMQIKLSETGTKLAKELHEAAEERGDCCCGLLRARAAAAAAAREDARPSLGSDEELRVVDEERRVPTTTSRPAPPTTQPSTRVAVSGTTRKAALSLHPTEHGWLLPPLEPGETYEDRYETALIIDSNENKEKFDVREFEAVGIKTYRCKLPVGDFAWLACPFNAAPRDTSKCFILDFLIERKEVNDLKASIIGSAKSGKRYDRQKYQMQHYTGIKNLMYLIEGDLSNTANVVHNVGTHFRRGYTYQGNQRGLTTGVDMRARLVSARVQSEIFDGFKVLNTENIRDTARLLKNLTWALHASYAPLMRTEETHDLTPFPTFLSAYETIRNNNEHTVHVVWMSMLAQIAGVGPEKASAIADKYPTPSSLNEMYIHSQNPATALAHIPAGKRSVGKVASENIQKTFFPEYSLT
jgi:crossover junction endonuclease MUS81